MHIFIGFCFGIFGFPCLLFFNISYYLMLGYFLLITIALNQNLLSFSALKMTLMNFFILARIFVTLFFVYIYVLSTATNIIVVVFLSLIAFFLAYLLCIQNIELCLFTYLVFFIKILLLVK